MPGGKAGQGGMVETGRWARGGGGIDPPGLAPKVHIFVSQRHGPIPHTMYCALEGHLVDYAEVG